MKGEKRCFRLSIKGLFSNIKFMLEVFYFMKVLRWKIFFKDEVFVIELIATY